MRIDSSGNVGIGGTVDNHGGYARVLQITGAGESAIELENSSGYGYWAMNGTTMQLKNVANGNMLFYTNNTEHMRITSAGAMTMGTTSSLTDVSGITLRKDTQGGFSKLLFMQNQPGTGGTCGADIQMGYASDYGSILRFYHNPFNSRNGGFQFRRVTGSGTSDLSMQIGTDGTVLINTTSTLGAGQGVLHLKGKSANTVCVVQVASNGERGLDFRNSSGTEVGSISVNSSSTAYNTSSDHRLKENVTADWDATTRLKQLNPVRFNFIADADTTVDGFLAHEVQSVVPEAISGTHNEVDDDDNPVYQGIDQSKLVPLLVKTIQELEARIVALETA
jgi:hypothetical protein